MMRFGNHFRDGIQSRGWSYRQLVDSEVDWVASGLFINGSDPFMPSWVCMLN